MNCYNRYQERMRSFSLVVMDNWICSWLIDCYQNTFHHDNNCTKHQCTVYHWTGYYNWTSNDVRPPFVSNVPPPISDHLSKHQNFPTRSPSVLITFFLTFCKQPLDSWCVLALFFAVCTTPLRVYEQLSVEHGTTCTADVTYKLRAINSLPKCRCVGNSSRKRHHYFDSPSDHLLWATTKSWHFGLSLSGAGFDYIIYNEQCTI